jgi:hypothetical protein
MVQSQPRQIVCKTLSQKKKKSQKRGGRMAQGVGPEFKLQEPPPNSAKKKKNHGTSTKTDMKTNEQKTQI